MPTMPLPRRLSRIAIPLLMVAAVVACTTAEGPTGALAGSWRVDSVPSPLTPLTLTLTQSGVQVTGTGGAMGVDTPVPLMVNGTYNVSAVTLTIYVANGSGGSIQYTAALEAPNHMVGTAVYYHLFTPTSVETYTLGFTRP